ncbi:MAG: hypothetical protein GY868_06520 [Deltaproteobacteria bacterium]|nr:hypothetical protein [Deltaproteobacteria bacterium]
MLDITPWFFITLPAVSTLCLIPGLALLSADAAAHVPAGQQILWQKDIRQLVELDRAQPPQTGGILFTGSSIFRFWSSLEQDLDPLPVINRAFGGARTWEVLHYMEQIVLPYQPSIIMYYCGSNDIEFNAGTQTISQNFRFFVARIRQDLPRTRIYFVSINRAPQKITKWSIIDAANKAVQEYCRNTSGVDYIDVNQALFDARQQPRYELFQEDGLHLRQAAYRAFTAIIKPILLQTWQNIIIK